MLDNRDPTAAAQWSAHGRAYRALIADSGHSSSLLREVGLKPTVARLLGDCSWAKVLDAGCGGGWLFDTVRAGEAHACDLIAPDVSRPGVAFERLDVCAMSAYGDAAFDAVVSSLVLCYCGDLERAVREHARVTRPGGVFVVALVHPYFYRTGDVLDDGSFHLTMDLAEAGVIPIEIGQAVGPFRYHYRGLPHYINAAANAGFLVERIEDWFFDPEAYAESEAASDGVARSSKVPVFTFVKGRRLTAETSRQASAGSTCVHSSF